MHTLIVVMLTVWLFVITTFAAEILPSSEYTGKIFTWGTPGTKLPKNIIKVLSTNHDIATKALGHLYVATPNCFDSVIGIPFRIISTGLLNSPTWSPQTTLWTLKLQVVIGWGILEQVALVVEAELELNVQFPQRVELIL